MKPARVALAVALAASALFVGSRILATSDRSAAEEGRDPREVLARHPLAGHAFSELAKAETDPARKLELSRIAARRDPRDLEVRAWLVEQHLAAGEHAAALEHLDVLLRLAPSDMREALLPVVVQLAADEAFAASLVDVLADEPEWRRALLATMRDQREDPGSSVIFAALSARGDLAPAEQGQWLDVLIRAGAWGQAYALWASSLDLAPGEPLPMLWNGEFQEDPDELGFGWRIGRAPGSYAQFEALAGADGRAARIVFLGRQVRQANLEQPLHLPPGQYRLNMRLRAQSLRSDQGLRWNVTCAGGNPGFDGEPINGSFDWRNYTIEIDVPITDCPGQWLRLQNPAPQGAASIVSGELWVDSVTLDRVDNRE